MYTLHISVCLSVTLCVCFTLHTYQRGSIESVLFLLLFHSLSLNHTHTLSTSYNKNSNTLVAVRMKTRTYKKAKLRLPFSPFLPHMQNLLHLLETFFIPCTYSFSSSFPSGKRRVQFLPEIFFLYRFCSFSDLYSFFVYKFLPRAVHCPIRFFQKLRKICFKDEIHYYEVKNISHDSMNNYVWFN